MPQALTDIGLPIALILIMIGVGLSLTPVDFTRVFKQPKSFIIGALCQMLLLPLVAIVIIALTELSGELAIGLFVLALCPGGTTSNLYSYLAKADVGLSVTLTAIIGFVTPFTIPLLTAWAITFYSGGEAQIKLPIVITWLKLMVVTVIPVLIGMVIRAKWQAFAHRAQPFVSGFSVSVLALVILSICIKLGQKLVDFAILTGPAVIALNIITMGLGYLAGKLLLSNEAQSRTITLEVGLQNGTLALLVTSSMLHSNAMSIAPSIYSLFMFISASLFTLIVSKKDKALATNSA
ncbi:bile acid:sodium symporter family protein [Psychrobium sp. 1_MG-2023]|uniref:bile acid:sodium symporter family protein n=1 Tax=Psychrobium sp. 1_MG-2023 TaxID=3062624 RepID=UPI000C34A464|nr:bile acid:sodium symporter family protein [Psychrobium sp. 1_MG-2023]MDP2561381.1 bile acid:sodium symporter family protein [Psychrobium sp. 1_MG-2023]PKF54862.1 Na+-dependent transporter [Alteromonadales bacterium alter-6D02]